MVCVFVQVFLSLSLSLFSIQSAISSPYNSFGCFSVVVVVVVVAFVVVVRLLLRCFIVHFFLYQNRSDNKPIRLCPHLTRAMLIEKKTFNEYERERERHTLKFLLVASEWLE